MSNDTLFRLGTSEGWCTKTHFFDQRMRGPVDFTSLQSGQFTLLRELPHLAPTAAALLYMMSAAMFGLPPNKPKHYFGFIDHVEVIPTLKGGLRVVYTVHNRELVLRVKTKSQTDPQLDLMAESVK